MNPTLEVAKAVPELVFSVRETQAVGSGSQNPSDPSSPKTGASNRFAAGRTFRYELEVPYGPTVPSVKGPYLLLADFGSLLGLDFGAFLAVWRSLAFKDSICV